MTVKCAYCGVENEDPVCFDCFTKMMDKASETGDSMEIMLAILEKFRGAQSGEVR